MNPDLLLDTTSSVNDTVQSLSDYTILAQENTLDLTDVNTGSSAPKISIKFSEGQKSLMDKIGIIIGLIWFFFFVLKLAMPGRGGQLGQMAQKVGGIAGAIIAFILVLALIEPEVMISIINTLIRLGYLAWNLLAGALGFK